MKKTKINTGGHKVFYPDDITHLNEAIEETANALGKLFGENFYLTNTVIVNNAGFYQCAAGCMVYKGELCYFDAQNVATEVGKTLCWVPDITYRLAPILYADNTPRTPHEIKKVKLQMVNLSLPPADYKAFNEFMQKGMAINALLKAQFIQIGSGGTAKSVDWNNSTEPNDVFVRRNISTDSLVYSFSYEFKGALTSASIALSQYDPTVLFTLPASLRPTRDLMGCVPVVIRINEETPSMWRHYAAACKLNTDGEFIVYMPGAAGGQKIEVWFDGLVLHEESFIL